MKNKIIKYLLLPIVLLSSCTCASKDELFTGFFDDYEWTKWTSQNNEVEIFVEGKGVKINGIGSIGPLGIDKAFITLCKRPFTKSSFEYISENKSGALNIEKNNSDEYPLRVFDDKNSEIEFLLKPTKILPSEIDLRYMVFTSLKDETENLKFKCPSNYSESNVLVSTYNDVQTNLEFLENNQFIFTRGELESKGNYTSTYENAVLTFSTNEIFIGKDNITFTYKK